jgi:pimeloyl-ACP methyl ester carboxylesterase
MEFYFKDKGTGVPVVLIHGFCETGEIWDGFDKLLSEFCRVITIDLPGFGKTPLPSVPFTIDDIASLVIDFLASKGIESPVIVGHSLGGYVALAIAVMDPDYSNKIVLFHSSIFSDSPEKQANRDKVIDFVSRNGVIAFTETFVPSLFADKNNKAIQWVRSVCDETPINTLVEYTKAMRDRPSREDFVKNFDHDVLVIAGNSDDIIPLEISTKMAHIIKNSHFLVLEGTGHMGMIETPEQAANTIKHFIEG